MISRLKENKPLFSWLLLLVLALVWGSSFILIKKGLLVFSAGEVGALRILSAALFSLPIAIPVLRKLSKRHLLLLLLIGFLGSFIPAFLFAFAETAVSSSLTGMLNALTPLFVLTMGVAFFGQHITAKSSVGLVIGFAGSLVLMLAGNGESAGDINYYALLVVLATLCYGVNLNIIKNFLSEVKPATITSVSLLFVGPLSAVYLLFFSDFTAKLTVNAWWPLAAVILLGVLGTVMALILFNKLVQMQSAVFASLVTYLIPIVAVFWGLIDGEVLTYQHFIGMITVLGGVYLVNRL